MKKFRILALIMTCAILLSSIMIPVSAGNKRKLNGFIHDESATGKTFYIEPVEVVELNNPFNKTA